MRNIQYLTIDLNKKTQQDVTANEGEIGSRFLKIKITDSNVPVDLTGTKVYLYALKSDNTKLFNLVEIVEATQGVVLAELTSQLLTSAGVVKLTLVLTEGTKKLISKEFTLKVDDSIFDDDAIVSTNEFTALTTALGQVQNIDNRFNEVNAQFISIKSEKANLDFVINELGQKRNKNESITMSDLNTDVKQAMTGGSVAVVGVDAVGNENVKSQAVKLKQLDSKIKDKLNNVTGIKENLTFLNAELNNSALFNSDEMKLTIPVGFSGANTLLKYSVNKLVKSDITVTIIFTIQRNLQFGSFTPAINIKRDNTSKIITPTETTIDFLTNNNHMQYTSKFNLKANDLIVSPYLHFNSSTNALSEYTCSILGFDFYYEKETIINNIEEDIKTNTNYINSISNILDNNSTSLNLDKVIYREFDEQKDVKCIVSNGSTKVSDFSYTITTGSNGLDSYISSDGYIKSTYTPRTIRIYSVLNISNTDVLNKENIVYNLYIPKIEGGFDTISIETNYIQLNKNVSIMYCDYNFKGTEEYIKIRAINRNAIAVNSDVTVFCGGFCYSLLKNNSTINKAFTDSIQLMINKSLENINNNNIQKEVLFNSYTTEYNSITKTINSNVYFEITENYNTTLRVFGVKNGKEYLLPIINLATGTTLQVAVYCAKYKVISEGYSEFRFERKSSSGTYGELIAYLLSNCNETPIKDARQYNKIDSEKILNNVKICNGISTYGIRNNKMIGTKINGSIVEVMESDNDYTNFVKIGELPNSTEHPSHVEICGDNSVIFISRTGKVYRTENLINYVEVLDIKDHIYAWGGFTQLDAVNNIVLVSEYRLPSKHNLDWTDGGGKLYLSEDYGKTFKVIFDLPVNDPDGVETRNTHIHAIKFDPYENIVWIVTGDGMGNQMIWYSLDKGLNWYQSTDFRQNAIQMTSIYPLKNCVLFGSDGRLVGVVRYNRSECGTLPNVKMNFDFPLILAEGWGKAGSTGVPVGSRGAIDYKNSKVYFGFLGAPYIHTENTYGVLKNGEIWVSDGYTIELIFKSDSEIDYGVIAVYEDFENNKAIGKLGREGKFVEINSDIWIKN